MTTRRSFLKGLVATGLSAYTLTRFGGMRGLTAGEVLAERARDLKMDLMTYDSMMDPDWVDIVYNIDPTETPFITSFATHRSPSWVR